MFRGLLILSIIVCFTVDAYAQRSIQCSSLFYQTYSPEGQLLSYNVDADEITFAPNNAGRRINAMGYRLQDGFAYGVTFTRSDLQLVRLAGDGSVEELGPVDGLSNAPLYPVGDFGGDDLLYVNAGGTSNTFNIFHAIDVDTASVVKSITIAGPNFGISDVAYNPVDGLFYSVTQNIGASQVPSQTLIAIDMENGTFEEIGPTGLQENGVFGSMYADARGNVYGSDRIGLGFFYQLDTDTGAATEIGMTLPEEETASIDGFSCSAAPGPFAPTNVPTLSQWGLIAMAAVLGIIGFMVVRRRALA